MCISDPITDESDAAVKTSPAFRRWAVPKNRIDLKLCGNYSPVWSRMCFRMTGRMVDCSTLMMRWPPLSKLDQPRARNVGGREFGVVVELQGVVFGMEYRRSGLGSRQSSRSASSALLSKRRTGGPQRNWVHIVDHWSTNSRCSGVRPAMTASLAPMSPMSCLLNSLVITPVKRVVPEDGHQHLAFFVRLRLVLRGSRCDTHRKMRVSDDTRSGCNTAKSRAEGPPWDRATTATFLIPNRSSKYA